METGSNRQTYRWKKAIDRDRQLDRQAIRQMYKETGTHKQADIVTDRGRQTREEAADGKR